MKVLLVDDEPVITQGLKILVDWEKEGFEIAGCVENGVEALKFLEKNPVDLILTDIRMPECNGLELLNQVKTRELSDAFFIIMSGYDEFDYVKQAIHMGCLDYLLKPVDAAELVGILRKIREKEQQRNEDEKRLAELEKASGHTNLISKLIGTFDSKALQKIILSEVLDRLIRAVEVGDQTEITEAVHDFWQEGKEREFTEETMDFNVSYLLFQLIRLASEQDDEINHEEIMRFISESSFEESVKTGNQNYMASFLLEYADYISQLRQRTGNGVLKAVEREIKEHYAENISLRELSRKFFINNAYLGQMFKKQYGVSFKDYLTDYRIKEAARMLLSTDRKIISIAEEVGYKDSDYFVQKFIERMGCTPSQYRRGTKQS